ncbi:peptidoglycan D,D-transpeptidase FtsI family protein [Rhodococcus sp. UNC363MFTsu5.1]|uniref:peptidoglycan D,D-transpeptidase FtsI family protein n=1 Tax=Rhodococcus sp. UNC363MFTsu5.1 TaxID=1449069 RepID=UPI00047F431C|nr:penicillin-binding protein 2 [Rhodococcus sp. UNC363MFTsu5.1]
MTRGTAPAPAPRRAPVRRGAAQDDTSSFRFRYRTGRITMFIALGIASVQLLWIQGIEAPKLSAEAANQRSVTVIEPAVRGSITDRRGNPISFTMEAKALTFQPTKVRKELEAARAKSDKAPTVDERLEAIAKGVNAKLGDSAPKKDLLAQLKSNETFVYLARSVDPAVAAKLSEDFPEIGLERQDIREYPGGSLAANLVGATGWDGHGLLGLEDSLDSTLAGTDGSQTYDRGSDGAVIPGSWRDKQPAVDGSTVELTIDSDLQYYVQQQVQQAKNLSGAKNASAVVLDSHTGEVLAMSNDNTFNPSLGVGNNGKAELGNLPVSTPFEPGSVNKIVTAAAAIEYGLTKPDEVLQVPGSIQMAGVSVKDAWPHGVAPYTSTGVFGKSSNVGTLMLAQRVGEDRFADMLTRFGLGQRTDVGLPGESAGDVPSRDQWSGGTFANLPIGQGLSMTLLQMTAMYQAMANDGVRIPPRVVRATIDADGDRTETERPEGIQVVSAQTAATVRDMFRAVTQRDPMGYQQGTGAPAAVDGYQISGKTGTAQQVDPACKCYSNSNYWITFAGIAPADNPRFVVGIMLDAPVRSADGSGGQSAAPLFHNIASWMLQRDRVPLSADPGRQLVLQAD